MNYTLQRIRYKVDMLQGLSASGRALQTGTHSDTRLDTGSTPLDHDYDTMRRSLRAYSEAQQTDR